MLRENLRIKYNELNDDLGFSHCLLTARLRDTVFYSKDGKSASQKKLTEFAAKGYEARLASKIYRKCNCNVVEFFSTNNTAYAAKSGGIPTFLDDFTEIFGTKLRVTDNDEKAIVKALGKYRAVMVKDKFVILTARSLDEAGTMTRIIDKNAFVMSKCPDYVKINPVVAKGMNIGFTYFYSKKNQKRIWQKELSEPIEKTNSEELQIKDIYDEDKRVEALRIARKIYADNYTQGTWGNVSVRRDKDTFYCTPKAIGYNLLTPEDMVLMNCASNRQMTKNNKATSEKGIHSKIMKEFPDCYTAVHAHPVYCSIFAARNKDMEISDENKSLLGERIYCSKHALPMSKRLAKNSFEAMKGSKAGIMGNHGIIACGNSIEEVFEILYALEYEAKKAVEKFRK